MTYLKNPISINIAIEIYRNITVMEKKILEELKKKLEQEKSFLEKDLSRFADKNKQVPYDYSARFPNPGERPSADDENAEEIETYDRRLALEHALETRLKEVGEALGKIKKNDGSYGRCEICGKPISIARLRANPAAKTCSRCAGIKNKSA